jgi:hypothetical protein
VGDPVARRLLGQAHGEEAVRRDQPGAQAREREQAGLVGARAGRRQHRRVVGGGVADAEQRDHVAFDVGAQCAERVLAVIVAGRVGERARDRRRHPHRARREQDRRRRRPRQPREIQLGQRRHDVVGTVQLGGRAGRGQTDAADPGRARRPQPRRGILDRDRLQRLPGRRAEPGQRQAKALRIGLAARDVLGGDNGFETIAQPARVEHGVDLRAPRPRNDRQARARPAQRAHQRPRAKPQPGMLAGERRVHVLFVVDGPRQRRGVDGGALVMLEQRHDRPAIVVAEKAPVYRVGDRDAERRQGAPKGLEVDVFVIDQDTVEIEQDRSRHHTSSTTPVHAACRDRFSPAP